MKKIDFSKSLNPTIINQLEFKKIFNPFSRKEMFEKKISSTLSYIVYYHDLKYNLLEYQNGKIKPIKPDNTQFTSNIFLENIKINILKK